MSEDLVEKMYASKQADYFSLEREIFKNAITGTGLCILDVGCGTGVLGAFFRNHQQCRVYGIEINEAAFQVAKENLTEVLKANVETMELPYQADFFDAIIMGDVLEHLINPVEAIKKLLPVLKPGGKIYITVPNIRHWKELRDLVFKDKWEYASWGILDFTHLRFFTKTSIVKLMQQHQINVLSARWVIQQPSKSSLINKLTFGLLEGMLASHTFLVIQK